MLVMGGNGGVVACDGYGTARGAAEDEHEENKIVLSAQAAIEKAERRCGRLLECGVTKQVGVNLRDYGFY